MSLPPPIPSSSQPRSPSLHCGIVVELLSCPPPARKVTEGLARTWVSPAGGLALQRAAQNSTAQQLANTHPSRGGGGNPPQKNKTPAPSPISPKNTPCKKKKRGCPPPCATLLGALARVSFPLCPGDPGGRPGPGAAVYFLACNYNLPKLHGILWIIVSELFLFPTNVALQMWKQPWRRARGEEERGEGKKGEKE